MIGIVATLKVLEGKGPELEKVFVTLAGQVRSNEPGNIAYVLTKSRGEANIYKVLELYDNEAAVAAHRAAPHFVAASPKIGACVEGRPLIEILDAV
ncbi:MAG: antibiotic biosynthesis monooxygenase [Caulobacteraceae bacterium]|nr:antibiotic biosynthesis monooxygenase [Caulobacteraceae bacterium]